MWQFPATIATPPAAATDAGRREIVRCSIHKMRNANYSHMGDRRGGKGTGKARRKEEGLPGRQARARRPRPSPAEPRPLTRTRPASCTHAWHRRRATPGSGQTYTARGRFSSLAHARGWTRCSTLRRPPEVAGPCPHGEAVFSHGRGLHDPSFGLLAVRTHDRVQKSRQQLNR